MVQPAEKYIEDLHKYRQVFAAYPSVNQQIDGILRNIWLLKHDRLPHELAYLGVPENFFVQVYPEFIQKRQWTLSELGQQITELDRLLCAYRDYLEIHFGMWSHTTQEFVADLARLPGRRYLEVMAGNGYISAGLRHLGQTVFATDTLDWVHENETGRHLVTEVEALDACTAYKKYVSQIDYVIMSWSPDGVPIDWQLLQLMRQTKPQLPLFCIGERNGCTNSTIFWQNANFKTNVQVSKLNRHLPRLDLVKEALFLVQ
ncbi:class I SAM-dependent methyltransferase [Loigolactobacillus iwatensis]|uniref:SAM-dependent methyltransferase n=1 Tax=Loigolactobacillus iwatensis TaxID=1267156 RepID=UPI000F7E12B0|nr:SAM-dependent methyltransferase [Loigolactobacillus iwatensis]